MSTRAPRMAFGLMIGLAGLLPAGADAASSDKKSTAYRWVDEQGIVHYGDSIPPQYAEKEHAVLNNQGLVVGHSDAQKTPEQQGIDAKEQEATRKQQQHDTFLLATYTSVKDIESLRDVRLDQLQGQRTAAEQYVENLHSRLVALQGRAKHFRPYNARPDARRMPDDLAEDLVHTLNEMRSQSNALSVKNEEVTAVRAQFNMDIDRYRALHEPRAKR
jgi:Domain of unknown function (DUF4124)